MRWATIASAKRILAEEQGTIIKDWGGKLPMVLVYPNSYYVGMSSLALQTLYRLLNERPDIVCERSFASYPGLEQGMPPLSLESQHELSDFGVLAATFSFELDYLHFATLLRRSGIPPLAEERDENEPLVLAGGPAVSANPEPLADLCDVVVIGEVEEILPDLCQALLGGIVGDRRNLLQDLARIPGVYVPALARSEGGRPVATVQRQWARDLDRHPTHTAVCTRATEFGDMYLIEIARGCGRGCSFCLAGCLYRPPRERSAATVLRQAEIGRRYRSKVGLVSAAVSDYTPIDEVLAGLRQLDMQVSVSSLRVDPLSEELLAALANSHARTLTIAPEAGSERLRFAIHKRIHDDEIISAARRAAQHGFQELKLYFMVGLPGETDQDMDEIANLVAAIGQVFSGRILASVAPFVPKAQTPFEREGLAPLAVFEARLRALRMSLKAMRVRMTSESVAWAEVQAVLARGDRRLGRAIASLHGPSLAHWQKTLDEQGLASRDYTAARSPDALLPWAFVQMGELEHRRR